MKYDEFTLEDYQQALSTPCLRCGAGDIAHRMAMVDSMCFPFHVIVSEQNCGWCLGCGGVNENGIRDPACRCICV